MHACIVSYKDTDAYTGKIEKERMRMRSRSSDRRLLSLELQVGLHLINLQRPEQYNQQCRNDPSTNADNITE
jgi:hypothetical protein